MVHRKTATLWSFHEPASVMLAVVCGCVEFATVADRPLLSRLELSAAFTLASLACFAILTHMKLTVMSDHVLYSSLFRSQRIEFDQIKTVGYGRGPSLLRGSHVMFLMNSKSRIHGISCKLGHWPFPDRSKWTSELIAEIHFKPDHAD